MANYTRNPNDTPRQREVLELLLDGHNDESISNQLGIALETVKRHSHMLYRKHGVSSRLELAVTVLKQRHADEIAAIHCQYQRAA
jgi:DNA-binding NarL/FixJ family response regulator